MSLSVCSVVSGTTGSVYSNLYLNPPKFLQHLLRRMSTKVQTLAQPFHLQHNMLDIIERTLVLKELTRITVGEFGCSGISAQLIETLIAVRQAWAGVWSFTTPQTFCQASCLALRPIAIKVSSTSTKPAARFLFFPLDTCHSYRNATKTSCQEVRKRYLRSTITVFATCCLFNGKVPLKSPVIRDNFTGYATY